MVPPPARRTQAERSKASREKIIHEATRFFAQNGFRGTKLRDIAQAVDMSEPGLLHHFPSKDHLLISVLEERDRIDQENYGKNLGRTDFNIVEAFKDLVEHNETVPGLVQLFTILIGESIPSGHPSHDYFVKRYQSARATLTEEIKNNQTRGTIRSDINPEVLATLIFAMMDGLQIQWLLNPEDVHMSEAFNDFINLIQRNSTGGKE